MAGGRRAQVGLGRRPWWRRESGLTEPARWRGEDGRSKAWNLQGKAVRAFNIATLIMVLFGAICLGLQGQFQVDLISWACGTDSLWPRAIHALIGLSGLWQAAWLATHKPHAQRV